jgi:hypothetical protein
MFNGLNISGHMLLTQVTAEQGRSCSLVSKRMQHALRNGSDFTDVAVYLPRQMLSRWLVIHTP